MSKYLVGNEPVQPVRKSIELNEGEAEFYSLNSSSRYAIASIMANFERADATDYSNSIAFDGELRNHCLFYALIAKDGRHANEAHDDQHVYDFIKNGITGEDFTVLSDAVLEDAGFMANDQLVGEISLIKEVVCYISDEEEDETEDDEEEETVTNQYAV